MTVSHHFFDVAGTYTLLFSSFGTPYSNDLGFQLTDCIMTTDKEISDVSVVFANLLIPGRGEPIKDAAVVWQGNKILYAGSQRSIPAQFCGLSGETVPVLMPGMWDCHIHFLGATKVGFEAILSTPQILAGARSVKHLHQTLMAGFTSVREVGGYGCELAKAVNEGYVVGPTIYSAHSAISMTGGHGDVHSMPIDHLKDLCNHGIPFTIVDGVAECIKAVRLQIRRGARLIKVCASGGVLSDVDNPQHQEFSAEELEAMVNEANRSGLVVAAHCHGKQGIMAALRAGCKTIEHGSFLDSEAIDLMLKTGAMLVPTRTVIEGCLEMPGLFSAEANKKMMTVADAHMQAYKMAIRRGVQVAIGTDIFISSNSCLAYGRNGGELVCAVKAGMTPLQAIEAATANGPATLGEQAPKSGQLKEGYEVDMLAVSRNPLDSIECIADSDNILRVWKQGGLVKS